ncbi:SRPBCC family protein [Leeuwenhoekiella sp. A16]|uniref:SRPBCC family protein n=1 Tax=unclassified Leeuwenhoekiella TaxID=2615029 RepID=UPI003A7FD290|tara:strand:+ start:14037 stop:14429 length:393 start_codon:yes stop_codon:yes gene_type:complete
MNLESPVTVVEKTPEEIYNFLIKVENYERLMPDNIQKFEILSDTRFLFALKGMPEIVLELKDKVPFNKVVLGAASDKLPFTLISEIKELTAGSSEVQLLFEGEFNPMISMMIKSPIKKFIETLATNLQNI